MTKLDDALQGVQRIGVDTAPVIYLIEANPQYDALVTEIFKRISNGVLEGICSAITLTEVLVQPLRQGDQQVAQDYTDLLLHSRHFATVSIDPTIATLAGDVRATWAGERSRTTTIESNSRVVGRRVRGDDEAGLLDQRALAIRSCSRDWH